MSEKKSYQSWTISDEFWETIKEDIPEREQDPKKKYVHAPGQGRKPMSVRKALEGIFYVLRTGCQWETLPQEYGSGNTVHRTFQKWLAAGFLRSSGPRVWSNTMNWKESAESSKDGKNTSSIGICWEESNGPRKMRTKRSVLTDEKGLPLAVVLSGANTHDVKLLEETLDHIVVLHPEPDEKHPQNLCLDAGYTGSDEKARERGYTPHIRPCGEEKKELERNPEFHTHRWVVEVTHSFFNRFRKLLVRFEKKAAIYLVLIRFACAVIVRRKILHVHR